MSIRLNSRGVDMLEQFLLDFKGVGFTGGYLDSYIYHINHHITEKDWYNNKYVFSLLVSTYDTELDHNGQATIVFTRNEMSKN